MVRLVTIGACAVFPFKRLNIGAVYFSFVSIFYHRVNWLSGEVTGREANGLGFSFPSEPLRLLDFAV
jgi:hypothetical protein